MAKPFLILSFLAAGCATSPAPAPASSPRTAIPAAPREAAPPMRFAELLEDGPAGPMLSQKARKMDGHRVRMVGYMAHLEEGPRDGFYLSPTPVHGDEMGAGTGDLPISAVRVHLHPVPRVLPAVEGLVAVEGRFELGAKEDADGHVSHLRLFVDAPFTPATKP